MALLSGDLVLHKQAMDFYTHLPASLAYIEPGLIAHQNDPGLSDYKRVEQKFRALFGGRPERKKKLILKTLSLGYQSFILYGLALAETYSEGGITKDPGMKELINTVLSYSLQHLSAEQLTSNPYAWTYNLCGFELAYALKVFGCGEGTEPDLWIREQLQLFDILNASGFSGGPVDEVIMASRIYEAIPLVD